MSEITHIASLEKQHWEETIVLAVNMLDSAEKKLANISLKYSGQLSLFSTVKSTIEDQSVTSIDSHGI